MKTMILKSKRISDLALAICIPTTLVLFVYVSLLTSNLQNISDIVAATGASGNFGKHTGDYDQSPAEEDVSSSVRKLANINLISRREIDRQAVIGPPLNNSVKCRQNLLLLTPIPRSGSVTLRKILSHLKNENGFKTISSPQKKVEVIHLETKEDQKSTASKVSAVDYPAVIVNSFAFINFTKFDLQQPLQISMVRDPLEKAISCYYYERAPYEVVERHKLFPEVALPSRTFLRKSLETCLTDPSDEECNYVSEKERIGHTIEYFCGHEPFCKLFGSKAGLQRAKDVVEGDFAVVGILEDIEKTLFVLEHFIPRFFAGAYKLYKETIVKDETNFNKNSFKPELEMSSRMNLNEKLSVEREFYNFLRRRLNKQYEAILDSYEVNRYF